MNISWVDSVRRFFYGAKSTPAPQEPENQHGTGALIDTRFAAQKEADIHFAEIVASAVLVQWVLKTYAQWRKFPIWNQDGSGSCVAFTMAKLLGIMRYLKDGVFVVFSMGHIYIRRSNQGSAGMIGVDAFGIASQGVTLDAIVPSQNLSEVQINALNIPEYGQEVAELFKLSNPQPILLQPGDIDAVASVIQHTGKGVMVWFYFTYSEWNDRPTSEGILTGVFDPRSLHHSVTAVDFTVLPDGKKALIIDDQWGVFGQYAGQRVIDEDWYRERNWFAAYPMDFKQEKVMDASPKYTFSMPLSFIPWDDAANAPADTALNAKQLAYVRALQTVLQTMTDKDGKTYFPTNVVPSGYYGALTAQGVYRWGCDHLLSAHISQDTLDALAGKVFGSASIAEMNRELA